MLLSMTGHGRALHTTDQVQVLVEVRSVNNRFLKTNINCDLDPQFYSQVESLVKNRVDRGSVNLKIKIEWLQRPLEYSLNLPALQAYRQQLSQWEDAAAVPVESLLVLPGVVRENVSEDDSAVVWPIVEGAVSDALDRLVEMRVREGENMASDLSSNCTGIEQHLREIKELAPGVIDNYSRKLTDRINGLLDKHDVQVEPADVIREVGVFAERVDISEEVVRLGSHIQQFREVLAGSKSNGRKLDFLTQEMLRETNTIGSKANDAAIANHVVEIKTVIERIREMVQNVE